MSWLAPMMGAASPRERRALKFSLVDGVLYAVMVGCSESYLGALAVELGHTGTTMAVLGTVPILAGAVAQLAAGTLTAWVGSRRRLVAAGALLQALTHVGFAWIAHTHDQGLWSLLLCKCAFWTSGMIIAPAWAAWMASLLEPRSRERYFAWRSGLVQLALVASFWWAGLLLDAGKSAGELRGAFVVLMLVALGARVASALTLSVQADPYDRGETSEFSPLSRLRTAWREGRWRVAAYVAGLGFGAHVAVPFFTPYMLSELQLDYRAYALLTTISISVKAVAFPLCHRLSGRIGLRATLAWGGLGVAIIPTLWTQAFSFERLVGIHVLSGASWAAIEYASFQLLLDSAKQEWRVEFLALAGSLAGVFQVAGSLFGGWLLEHSASDYALLFVLSSVARALPLTLLVALPGGLLPTHLPRLVYRLFGVGAGVGQSLRPVVADKPGSEPEGGTTRTDPNGNASADESRRSIDKGPREG